MASAKNSSQPIIVAIDGPAGSGKSTVARQAARQLGFTYLDTGAMYRSLTLKAVHLGIAWEDEQSLIRLAQESRIDFSENQQGGWNVFLDGQDVSEDIRTPEVTNNTFYVARIAGVRAVLVERQRDIAARVNIVAEGRDIGTVVFPQATKKIYLDADFKERALRRFKEIDQKGQSADATQIQHDLQDRDHKDFTRKVGPLKKADDAIVIDSTHLSIPDVVNKIIEIVQQHG